MRILLRDLAPGQDYAIQFQSSNLDGETSAWGPIYRFRTEGDVIAPKPVTNLAWSATGSSFLGTWDAVTVDGDNRELRDLRDYQVTVSDGFISKVFYVASTYFELTLLQNQQIFGDIAPTVSISVRPRDHSNNLGTAVSKTATEDNPPIPSNPTVDIVRGQIVVHWNGDPAVGIRNDLTLNHVEIHMSTNSTYVPSATTVVGRFEGVFPGPQSYIITEAPYDVKVYIKLVAVNRMGRKSLPSDSVEATSTRLSGLDIGNGQISVDQINFADKLGGVKAFYQDNPPEPPSFSPTDGDIWYDTNDGYKPYKRTAGAWVADPNIGVISGTRILAGTLTSNAVGTNLLITSAANIGSAVIDSANISSLVGDKIVAGTIQSSSTVTYGGGTPRPAWSLSLTGDMFINSANVRGDLVIGNSGDTAGVRAASLVRSFDYIANTSGWAIKGDGSVEFNNGVFRGAIVGSSIVGSTYQTSNDTTLRRVTIATTGTQTGAVLFSSGASKTSQVRGYTSTGGVESIQSIYPIANTSGAYNSVIINENEEMYTYTRNNYQGVTNDGVWALGTLASKVSLDFTARLAVSGSGPNQYYAGASTVSATPGHIFHLRNPDNSLFQAFQIDGNSSVYFKTIAGQGGGFTVNESVSGITYPRMWLHSDRNNYFFQLHGKQTTFNVRRFDGTSWSRMYFDQNYFTFNYENGSRVVIGPEYGADASPSMSLIHDFNYGTFIAHVSTTSGTSHRLEFHDAGNTIFENLWAATFVQSSSIQGKQELGPMERDSMEVLNSMRVTRFKRKMGQPRSEEGKKKSAGKVQYSDRIEVGIIAEEAPDEVRIEGGDQGPMVDLGAMLAVAIDALKNVNTRLTKLEEEINNKGENK